MQKRKPFLDGEMAKTMYLHKQHVYNTYNIYVLLITVMEFVLEDYEVKTKSDSLKEVKYLRLSHQTITCRIQNFCNNTKCQLIKNLKNSSTLFSF